MSYNEDDEYDDDDCCSGGYNEEECQNENCQCSQYDQHEVQHNSNPNINGNIESQYFRGKRERLLQRVDHDATKSSEKDNEDD